VAPDATAGPDQQVLTGATVNLIGAANDANGDSLTYLWSLTSPEGSIAILSDVEALNPSFTPNVGGEYTATLTVNDGDLTASDSVIITARDAPIADVGENQSIDKTKSGSVFPVQLLDGSGSSVADGLTPTYTWRVITAPKVGDVDVAVVLVTTSSTTFPEATPATPGFHAIAVGDYTFGLTVNDGLEDSVESEVTITVEKDFYITSGHLFGSALFAFALFALPARKRKKLKAMRAVDS
jgi:hypothetical protein